MNPGKIHRISTILVHPRSLTASLPLRNVGWETILSYWECTLFRGQLLVSGSVGALKMKLHGIHWPFSSVLGRTKDTSTKSNSNFRTKKRYDHQDLTIMFGDLGWCRFPFKKITGRFTAQAIQAENQRRQVRICARISGVVFGSHGGLEPTLELSLKLTYDVDGSNPPNIV